MTESSGQTVIGLQLDSLSIASDSLNLDSPSAGRRASVLLQEDAILSLHHETASVKP